MRLMSILNTKAIWLFKTNDLNPRGAPNIKLVADLHARYQFQTMPTPAQIAEFLTKKTGVLFGLGTFAAKGGPASVSVTYYADGLMVETQSGTEVGDEFLADFLEWLRTTHATTDIATLTVRKIYSTELYFTMERNLTLANPKLQAFAEKFGRGAQWPDMELQFGVTGITFGPDPISKGQHPPFRLERDTTTPFSENRYFSAAPLQTEDHLAMIREFEDALSA